MRRDELIQLVALCGTLSRAEMHLMNADRTLAQEFCEHNYSTRIYDNYAIDDGEFA